MNHLISLLLTFYLTTMGTLYTQSTITDNIIEDITTFTNIDTHHDTQYDSHAIEEFKAWEISTLPVSRTVPVVPLAQKPWTFIVYMAADNDLRNFAAINIQQMAAVGSNQYINIIVHLDIKLTPTQKVTRHYYIQDSSTIYQMNTNDPYTQSMDSGNPNTLVVACNWAAQDFPAANYALILWNHGTGILDPARYKISRPDLFIFNSINNLFELDRSVSFIDVIEQGPRGICWDDSTGNFLNNQKLSNALNYICKNILGKKFSIIGFDACLMSMIEVGNLVAPYANIMVGSQEVEMGAGWPYDLALQQFLHGAPTPQSFATTIVSSYQKTYTPITKDFTLAAVNLATLNLIENNIQTVANLLLQCIALQEKNNITSSIKTAGNPYFCTSFEEPTYIDISDFYTNLLASLSKFKFKNSNQTTQTLLNNLQTYLQNGKQLITNIVFANAAGKGLARAKGLSIYFPRSVVHSSYPLTPFAQSNSWLKLIKICVKG